MIEIGLEEEKPQIEGIQENFEEGYVKAKKKWNGRRMSINSKMGKRGFN